MRLVFFLFIIGMSGVGIASDLDLLDPTVPDQRAVLLDQLEILESWLSQSFRPDGWAVEGWTSFEWARYIGGLLSTVGYKALLVSSSGEWWVLVGLTLEERTVWFPVVPAVRAGSPPQRNVLAFVPFTDEGFLQSYLKWEEIKPLPQNSPPVAEARVSAARIFPGREVRFLGVLSHDPDGTIILFLWDFGDGTAGRGVNARHAFRRPGMYRVSLTVVDELGGFSQKELEVVVEDDSDCGCGG